MAVLVAGFGLCAGDAFASKMKLIRPEWAAKSCVSQSGNGSYLSRIAVLKHDTLNDQIFSDPGTNRAMRTEYENRVEADEKLANAGLSEPSLEKSRFQVMKDFARRAVNSVSRLRLKKEGDAIQRSAMNSPVRAPMAVAVLAASFYTGRAMNFGIGNGIRMSSTTVLKDRAASLSMHLPSPGLTSTVAYNPENQVSAQLSQRLSDKISAVVNSAQRGSAQVTYSVSF